MFTEGLSGPKSFDQKKLENGKNYLDSETGLPRFLELVEKFNAQTLIKNDKVNEMQELSDLENKAYRLSTAKPATKPMAA